MAASASLAPPAEVAASVRTPRSRWLLRWLLGAAAVLAAMTTVGAMLSPWLLSHHPLALVALSPLGRHMVLVAALSDMWPFVTIVAARRFVDGLVMYLIGYAHGEEAIAWLTRRVPASAGFLRVARRVVARIGPFALLIWPGIVMSLLVGSARMNWRGFAAVAVVGHVIGAGVVYFLGDALGAWITPIVGVVRANVMELSGAFVLLYLAGAWWRHRKKPQSDKNSI